MPFIKRKQQQQQPFLPSTASVKLKSDMVLEDVDSDNEGKQSKEARSKTSTARVPPTEKPTQLAPSTSQQQQEAAQQAQSMTSLSVKSTQSTNTANVEPAAAPAQSVVDMSKISLEDAETQTGRWTPFIDNIKKEAEGVAMATMEERYWGDELDE